jgi:hypothetical protein
MVFHVASESTRHGRDMGKEGDPSSDSTLRFGEDGLPLDQQDSGEARAARFREAIVFWEAQWRKSRNRDALIEALRELCRSHPKPATVWWIFEDIATLLRINMSAEEQKQRRDWDNHQRRWEALTELRERRFELAKDGDDRGTSWERARAAVSEILQGTAAEGAPSTIKASYELVEEVGGANATLEDYERYIKQHPKR